MKNEMILEKFLKGENFIEQFVVEDHHEPSRARRLAETYQSCLERAAKLLEVVPPRERLYFEGSCPSGSTYSPAPAWDGSVASKRAILLKVLRYAYPDAWRATLVSAKESESGRFVAGMRI